MKFIHAYSSISSISLSRSLISSSGISTKGLFKSNSAIQAFSSKFSKSSVENPSLRSYKAFYFFSLSSSNY